MFNFCHFGVAKTFAQNKSTCANWIAIIIVIANKKLDAVLILTSDEKGLSKNLLLKVI